MSQYERPRKTKKRRGAAVILSLFLALLLIAGAGYFYLSSEVNGRFRASQAITVEVPQGSGTADIAKLLEKNQVIGNSLVFRAYSKLKAKADGSYQYGTFELVPSQGYAGIIRSLQEVKQRVETLTVTFPEGYNAFQMGETLEKAGLCTQTAFIEALNTHSFHLDFVSQISSNPLKLVKLDGFLFPDTYEFYAHEDVDSIITRMLTNFETKVLTDTNKSALEASGYKLEELVVFASIIQKEAANVKEMYNVSSVFTNRMKPGSPYPQLESCTTNNYINDYMKPFTGGAPTQNQLSAYDTYGMVGFPVGAIANPGLDAIDAALHPASTDYYFFVTDIEFTHYYGKTWQEHLNNIEKAKAVNLTHGKVGL